MPPFLRLPFLTSALGLSMSAQPLAALENVSVESIDGGAPDLAAWRGRPVLIDVDGAFAVSRGSGTLPTDRSITARIDAALR